MSVVWKGKVKAMAFNVFGKTIMRNLFNKPVTKMYPIVKKEFAPGTRGGVDIQIDDCIFCGMCNKRCPAQAINVSRENKQWELDQTRCVSCSFCVDICPKKCLSMNNQYTSPMTDKTQRLKTFSGKKDDGVKTDA